MGPQSDSPDKKVARRPAVLMWIALIAIGVFWAATSPLSKVSVSTGYHPVPLTLWNTIISVIVLTPLLYLKKGRLPLDRRHVLFFLGCGLLGTAFPNSLSYEAYRHLPIGVISIVYASIPMTTLVVALLLRMERIDLRRLGGLALGGGAVALIAIPEASLPDPEQAIWVLVPVMVAISYAAENIYMAKARPEGCDALTVLTGLSWGALFLLIPTLLVTGEDFLPKEASLVEGAVVANTGLHLLAYFGFIWLIGHAGPVFASQVGYVVTGMGVLFGMIFFGESHSLWVWAALALMLGGVSLVKPRF